MKFKPFPIGVDDFEKLMTSGYYYVDKTLLIKELLVEASETSSREIFAGLKIMDQGDGYLRHVGIYPVITLSLKSTKQDDFKMAFTKVVEAISGEFRRHRGVLQGSTLDTAQKDRYKKIMDRRGDITDYTASLKFLSEVLYGYYGQKAIILIDEYDVPLEHAYFTGYCEQMSSFIRSFFEEGLKSNPFMEFSVVTGCLRITRESIFTGLNNLIQKSVTFIRIRFWNSFGIGRIDGYAVSSNQESGDGRYDILLKSPDIEKAVLLFELKSASSYQDMAAATDKALRQIKERRYGDTLRRDGYSSILCYGIAFYKKNCVVLAKEGKL